MISIQNKVCKDVCTINTTLYIVSLKNRTRKIDYQFYL